MKQVLEWLPAETLGTPIVYEAVVEVVREWEGEWFYAPWIVEFSARPSRSCAESAPPGGWVRYGRSISFGSSARGSERMAERLFDCGLARTEVTGADRCIIESVEHKAMADLADRLERLLDLQGAIKERPELLAEPFDRHGGVEIFAADHFDAQVLVIALPMTVATALRRAKAPRRRSVPRRTVGIGEAISPTKVTLEVSLGKARLALSEVRGLGLGDVVLLDRPIAQGAELRLMGARVCSGGTISRTDGRLSLTL